MNLQKPYSYHFFLFALMVRFCQGIGDQFVTIACFTIITIQYPEDKETYVGYAEAVIGLGLMAGPVIGAFFYDYVQY